MSKFALFFILVYLSGVINALFLNGAGAFLLYQAVYMINAEDRWWYYQVPDLRYSFVVSILMIFALVKNYAVLSAKTRWRELPVLKWIMLFLLLHYIAYFHGLNLLYHKTFTFNFLKLVIIFMLAYKLINTEKMLDACLWVYALGATYIGTVAKSVGRNGQGRVEGIGMVDTGGDANYTAAALAPAILVLLYYAWQGNWKIKLFAALCSAYVVNALILINSRGAFLGVVVGAGLFISYMLFSRYQKAGQRGTAILIIAAGLAGALSLADATFWERMQTLRSDSSEQSVSAGTELDDGRGRIYYWLATLDMVEDFPMGLGIGGYQALSRQYLGRNKVPHSTWFQVLGEFGWHGLTLYIVMLLSVFKLSRKTKAYLIKQKMTDAYFKVLMLECALITYLTAATFVDRARAEVLFWLILFISMAYNIYYLQQTRAEQQAKLVPNPDSMNKKATN